LPSTKKDSRQADATNRDAANTHDFAANRESPGTPKKTIVEKLWRSLCVVQAETVRLVETLQFSHVFTPIRSRASKRVMGSLCHIRLQQRAKVNLSAFEADRAGVLDDAPIALPTLTRAVKLQGKAAGAGFDWPFIAPVFAKLKEEFAEVKKAIAGFDASDIAQESATFCSALPTSLGI
jgi:hypothetical protein